MSTPIRLTLVIAQSRVDDCRDRLAELASSLEELARRRRPPDRLELEDLLAAVEVADEEARDAYMILSDGLEDRDVIKAVNERGATS